MTLPIKTARPPNYEAIVAVFPRAARKQTIFTYGGAIYCLDGSPLSSALMAHEMVHSERQIAMGVTLWWDTYLRDARFRFNEELLAHKREYEVACLGAGRGVRRSMLRQIAGRLSGPLYGNMVTLHEAKKLISPKEDV